MTERLARKLRCNVEATLASVLILYTHLRCLKRPYQASTLTVNFIFLLLQKEDLPLRCPIVFHCYN